MVCAQGDGIRIDAVSKSRSWSIHFVWCRIKIKTDSEVSWTTDTIPLPPEIVARFDGKVMVVVGNEFDIVRPTAENGTAQARSLGDFSVFPGGWTGFLERSRAFCAV